MVNKPRTRLVNFRLTDDEFENLRSAAMERGARSISDFARSAVLHSVNDADGDGRLDTIAGRLEGVLARISGLLDNDPASPGESNVPKAQPAQARTV